MAEYIEREAVLALVEKGYLVSNGNYAKVKKLINDISAADVKPVVRGEWIWTETGDADYEQFWVCSICGEHNFYEANFCPNCGADMRSKPNEYNMDEIW